MKSLIDQRHERPVEDKDNSLLEKERVEDEDDDLLGEEDNGILNALESGGEDDVEGFMAMKIEERYTGIYRMKVHMFLTPVFSFASLKKCERL